MYGTVYILICQQDDDYKSHGISFTHDLDTNQGIIHDLGTLLNRNAKSKPGAFDELIKP